MKKYRVVEYEMMPVRIALDNADVNDIGKFLCKDGRSCYPNQSNGYIEGKYKVLQLDDKCTNRFMEYFHTACVLLGKQIGKDAKDVAREVINITNEKK